LTHQDCLIKLRRSIESFLHRALQQKEQRLRVLDGINRLDDIARGDTGDRFGEAVGEWFARHNPRLDQGEFRPGDIDRIGGILKQIQEGLKDRESSPEMQKISSEIDRWDEAVGRSGRSITLKRGPEARAPQDDSIALFAGTLEKTTGLFGDLSAGRKHLLSVLDESLKAAQLQNNREALLLSAVIIYYLKSGGYKVEPYVKRLKEAERLQKEASHA
jgi:hypothetical protein